MPRSSYKKEITDRLLSQNLGDYLGAWYELMVYDWLDKSGKEPVLQPPMPNGKTRPEFVIDSNGLQISIEVTVVQEARRDRDVGGVWWPAGTSTFKKIGDKLREESRQHQIPQGSAYVICLGLESRLIRSGEVKTYFIGRESFSLKSGKLYPELDGEIFERLTDMPPLVKLQYVSGVLVTQPNRATIEGGYRLSFRHIPNPYALVPIPETEFDPL